MATYYKAEYELRIPLTTRTRTITAKFVDRSNAEDFAAARKGRVTECTMDDSEYIETYEADGTGAFKDSAWMLYCVDSKTGFASPCGPFQTLGEMVEAVNKIRAGGNVGDKNWLSKCDFVCKVGFYSRETHNSEMITMNFDL